MDNIEGTAKPSKSSSLQIENAVRRDSGKYNLILKNDSGKCDSWATVTVVGCPDQPEGPLVITDICNDGATLAWKPSNDDGGEPLEGLFGPKVFEILEFPH